MSAPNPKGDDFPILCETCLGPNPYVRMQKHPWGSACKVCERPFTSFRWRPAGNATRPKKTEICQTCARAKNVCQTCLLDLEYGLPVQVRDASMAAGDRQRTVVPKSDGTKEYAAAQSERAIATGEVDAVYAAPKVNDIAERAKRITPRYERNRSRICSFFLKGACTRGLYCPYRHEKPKDAQDDLDEALEEQNLRDRYYGVNDPVAAKIFRKLGVSSGGRTNAPGGPSPPDDATIQTLFVGGITAAVKEPDVRMLFAESKGISNISMIEDKGFAFVEFESRQAAEDAINANYGKHIVNGTQIFVNWGRGNRKRARHDEAAENRPSATGQNRPSSSAGHAGQGRRKTSQAAADSAFGQHADEEQGAKKMRKSNASRYAWDLLAATNSRVEAQDGADT